MPPKRKSTERLSGKLAEKKKKANSKEDQHSKATSCDDENSTASTSSLQNNSARLSFSFFDKPCDDLAKELLGKKLVRQLPDGQIISGIIVETEAYLGHPDKGAHSYKGKTNKNEAMFMPPATAYVYHIHSYCCMNISSKGDGAAVLLRALEPVDNKQTMVKLRQKKTPGKSYKDHELCNGPSKFCLSLDITKADINKEDMTVSPKIWLEDGVVVSSDQIVHSKRINIDYAEEWKDKLLRYYIRGNKSVSKKDTTAEKAMNV